MLITANRKDIAKCLDFIELNALNLIKFLSSVGSLMIISRISMKPLYCKWILFPLV